MPSTKPDVTPPLPARARDEMRGEIRDKCRALYGEARGDACATRLMALLESFRAETPAPVPVDPAARVDERDVMLITYGGSLNAPGELPLQTLRRFLRRHLRGVISAVHILPFFPYSSDDGFSVIDYTAVDPALGTWDDVRRLGDDFDLMFDLVINHVSAHSEWFRRFKAGDPAYADFFIRVDPGADLSAVVRPRTLPLLTPVETARGVEHVWTTFSDDQIDLNFANPDVLLRMVEVLLFYIRQGMTFLRLDAIAYLWKQIGTGCIHLGQTHTVVRLLRDVFDAVAPQVAIITETNVPHEENISYFGNGWNEAQLVYQFPLPPLTLHAFATGDATHLSRWAAGLARPSEATTFFNFTASHDGIGVRPLEGILPRAEIERLVERAQRHGGAVSYKANSDGSQSPYELNINYFDALSDPQGAEPPEKQVSRFLASQAIALALAGMPGIYIHSLLGSRNWNAGVARTGRLRTINREPLDAAGVERALADPASLRARVFAGYRRLIAARTAEPAFHPGGEQRVLALDPAIFGLLRTSPDGQSAVAALHNVRDATVQIDLGAIEGAEIDGWRDLLSGESFARGAAVTLAPYQVRWLKRS